MLFVYLVLQVLFSLLQHLKLRAEADDGILGRVFASLGGTASKPAPHLGSDNLGVARSSEFVQIAKVFSQYTATVNSR
jgi:hypothetical protein